MSTMNDHDALSFVLDALRACNGLGLSTIWPHVQRGEYLSAEVELRRLTAEYEDVRETFYAVLRLPRVADGKVGEIIKRALKLSDEV